MYREDSAMIEQFEMAEATGWLYVNDLESELRSRVTAAIRRVASQTLAGKIQSGIRGKPYGTPRTIEEYEKGLKRLLETIPDPQ